MNNIKFKRRIDSAVNAFFAGETSNENGSMTFANDLRLSTNESVTDFEAKVGMLVNILKQVFLFFPGTFLLFLFSFCVSIISINNPFHVKMIDGQIFYVMFWFAAAVFMTWFGIGDLRKSKHLVIPFSIVATGVIVGVFSGIASLMFYPLQHFIWSNAYLLYFFPLALIAPFLAKGLVDRKQEN